ncbi:MAG TPA: DUF4331 family protein [Candidatus Elarobacter sp.]|nr:DUF4331 family protein [Candidatus Elarobacter sp.]
MRYPIIALGALGALALGLVACNGGSVSTRPFNTGSAYATPNPTNPPASTQSYIQIELLARPAVKEVFENFNDHKTTNAVEPYAGSPADPLQAEIKSFEDTVRPPKAGLDYGATLASILYPNELVANIGDTADNASYLGVETGGATGGKFGGRDLGDDVVDISLGALFGNTLSKLGVIGDDGEENACLSNEHVAQNPNQAKGATFPYAAPPH